MQQLGVEQQQQMEAKAAQSGVRSWIRGSLIGAGAFGSVNLAVDNDTGELFAVKSTECSPRARSEAQALENELRILQSLSSPRVVRCLGSAWSMSAETGEPVRNVFLEYMPGGSLSDLMAKFQGKLPERLARVYTKGILEGLDFLHGKGVVHCDIKGKNVLVGSTGVKLADFGAAKDSGSCSSSGVSMMIKGTPLWMAPEVVRQEEQGPASDIWSLGCTVLEMITGKAPWSDVADPFVALYKIGCSDEVPEMPPASVLSEEGRDFVMRCLCREPRERWTSSQLLEHPFVTQPMAVQESTAAERVEFSSPPAPASPPPVEGRKAVVDWAADSGAMSRIFGEIPVHCTQQRPVVLPPPKLEILGDEQQQQSSSSSWGCNSPPASPATGKWIVVRSPQGSSPASHDAFNLLSDFSSDDDDDDEEEDDDDDADAELFEAEEAAVIATRLDFDACCSEDDVSCSSEEADDERIRVPWAALEMRVVAADDAPCCASEGNAFWEAEEEEDSVLESRFLASFEQARRGSHELVELWDSSCRIWYKFRRRKQGGGRLSKLGLSLIHLKHRLVSRLNLSCVDCKNRLFFDPLFAQKTNKMLVLGISGCPKYVWFDLIVLNFVEMLRIFARLPACR